MILMSIVLRTNIWFTLDSKNKLFSVTYIYICIFLLRNWCNRLRAYYACTSGVHRYFSVIRTSHRLYYSRTWCLLLLCNRIYCVIDNLSLSINKWRTLCRMILTFFKHSSAGFNTVVSFFHSARAQWTGGYAFILMLFRLFVSVRRARHRNARAVTARSFIEINIPEAARRFYIELARAPTQLIPGRLSHPYGGMARSEYLRDVKSLKTFRFSYASLRTRF